MARQRIRVGRRAGRLPTKRRILWRLHNTRESALAHRWLDGLRGVEIGGAAHNAFGLDTINVDRSRDMDTVYKREELELAGVAMAVDVRPMPCPFRPTPLTSCSPRTVLEQLPDPIRGPRGVQRLRAFYLFIVLPHRDRTFDPCATLPAGRARVAPRRFSLSFRTATDRVDGRGFLAVLLSPSPGARVPGAP